MASGLGGHMLRRGLQRSIGGPWNYVGGRRCDPAQTATSFQVTAPATGGVLCEVAASGVEEVDRAVRCAKEVLPAWSELSGRERGQRLMRACGIIRENLEDIARLEVQDTGKPIWEARVDIASCADALEYYGGLAPAIVGVYLPRA
ncbi:Betaine aldehyde dehydrogenase [Chionoecetes opilio]|uniref:Betaine aldehyde dehydrogenase n=1 Tax=Chionoecetes opilio TaxID=41210 RepID=A0A8J4XN02_CHIOP|nr:Betaine aldehyde dehydrogenase [Chionoecetes opilio]